MPHRNGAENRCETGETGRMEACVDRLARGDISARDELLTFACGRMEQMARRMLKRFPNVRRWDETGDVVQNAAIRLYRTLGKVAPHDAKGFLGLAAVQIRRELIDLARKYAGPESHPANSETNYQRLDGDCRAKVDDAADHAETAEQMARWTALHEAAEKLPPEEKELFDLVWYMGLDQQEAADMVGCSVRTIKRRWDSIKQMMRQAAADL
jgi:RNA polymerase sigma factor (sigma-70 family)